MNDDQLTRGEEWENVVLAMGSLVSYIAAIQWTLNTWKAQASTSSATGGRKRPHRMEIFVTGGVPGVALEKVRQYGINVQEMGMQWVIDGGVKGLLVSFLVPAPQWEMADAILYQHSGNYIVTSAPGNKRRHQFSKPWGVTAKPRSFDESINAWIAKMFVGEIKPVKAKDRRK